MKIGDNIRDIREKEKKLSKEQVAKALGITPKAYSNIENNVADVSVSRLYELAEIFEVAPEYILTYQEKSAFTNHFNNYEGNQGVNIMYQGCTADQIKNIEDQIKKSKQEASRLQAKTRNN
ncbi:helix-turn-helix transcriptional regulator [Chitinophaga sp. 212800010-3]|uniref:helix-turn-helix domain-containing protein n=1 Tax=Bacteroidota TaxID=976 RepID=UPI001AD4A268|nr:helix-turn-helix transcriptional regulator [Chitinophaga sp. 212800010-3]MBN8880596.1 helix-turn-helix transcriptional regulator [Sphingobacteriales bacterium]MBN9484365.1 helix-turn-helix transcriptional regulator [Bacteroidota bacterium]MEC5143545.1 HTH cro/C1-type domain-containing protein [Chitinophaga sp. 212800010-3]